MFVSSRVVASYALVNYCTCPSSIQGPRLSYLLATTTTLSSPLFYPPSPHLPMLLPKIEPGNQNLQRRIHSIWLFFRTPRPHFRGQGPGWSVRPLLFFFSFFFSLHSIHSDNYAGRLPVAYHQGSGYHIWGGLPAHRQLIIKYVGSALSHDCYVKWVSVTAKNVNESQHVVELLYFYFSLHQNGWQWSYTADRAEAASVCPEVVFLNLNAGCGNVRPSIMSLELTACSTISLVARFA